jgi:hypothetical protein
MNTNNNNDGITPPPDQVDSNKSNPRKVDLKPGAKFGRLTFVGFVKREPTPKDDSTAWFHLACDCGRDEIVPFLLVVPGDEYKQRCRECTEAYNKAVAAKAEARRHFNSFRAILVKWNRQLAYGKTQGPCQQLAAILRGD